MSTPPEFKTDPKRDASDSIRGYVYQAYQSVFAWMQLKENEILILEGAEDFDIHCGSSVTATQVKDVSGNLTLRTQAVVDTLNNYWAHRERNPGYEIVLRFLTTAEAGQEQGSPFGSGQKDLDYWNSAESDGIDIEPIRAFLLTLGLESRLALFIQTATSDVLLEKLIRRIKWDMGNRPSEGIQYNIEDKLMNHGFKLRLNSIYSCQALPSLFKKVADLLSNDGQKELRFSDFLTCFSEATFVTMPRGEMEAMASSGGLQQLVGTLDMAEMARLANGGSIIGNPMPKRGDSAFQTDLCLFEQKADDVWLPRVVLEFKTGITTHDILTYSAKAAKHKQIYPYLRYGLVASKDSKVPGRFFTHNNSLDFCLSLGGLSEKDGTAAFRRLLIEDLDDSRSLERVAFGENKYRLFRSKIVLDNAL
jgi:hypothetical protein